MKLTALLLLVTGMAMAGKPARAQDPKFTLNFRNAPLATVFKEIRRQSNFRILYNDELLKNAHPVSFGVKDASIEDVLTRSFAEQPLAWRIMEETIIVTPKSATPTPQQIADTSISNNPPIDVRGKIVNEKGEAVAGAYVTVKGATNTTATDAKGEFSLTGVPSNATLIVTSVTYETEELKLKGRSDVMLQVSPKVNNLTEVVVSTGYQTLPKERATGSFAQPDKEMFNARVSTDVLSKLEGITSGLVLNRSRTGEASISIRGRSTIFGNTTPLIVVDNFPYDGNINNINPNDIENVTILKDAAAASIWGVRAGNGVIVITTKKGKLNQSLKIEINSNVTVGEKPNLSYDTDFLDSSHFIDVETFLFNKGQYTADFSNVSKTPLSPVIEILNKRKLGQISAADSATQIDALRTLDVRNQYKKYYYQKPINQQYSLNISGGSSKANYYFSSAFDKNISSLVRNQNSRISLLSSLNFTPYKNLEISASINYVQSLANTNNTISDIRTGGSSKSYGIYPYATFKDPQGNILPIIKDYRGIYADTAGNGRFLNWRYYPLNELELADNSSKLNDMRINSSIKYTLIHGLTVEIRYQYEKGITQSQNYYSAETYYSRNLINKFTTIRPDGSIKNNIPLGGILNFSNSELSSKAIRGALNYSNEWDKHSISVIAGAEGREVTVLSNFNATSYGFDPSTNISIRVNYDSTFNTNPSSSSSIPSNNGVKSTIDRFRSYFANAAYTYKERYTLSLSGRIDQSNLFGVETNQKSVPLWSTGIKWDVNKEPFYNVSWLPILKLRATYGYNGNLNKSLTAYTTASYISIGLLNLAVPYAQIQSPGNEDLRWEKIGIYNVGVDFELKKGILAGSIDYYQKKGIDLIGDAPLPSSTGFTSAKGNYSNMKGQGIDVSLSSINVSSKEFKWQSSLLLSYSKDKVTKYKGTTNSSILEGRPVSYISTYPWANLDPITGDPRGYLADTITKDYSNLIKLTPSQQVYNGPSNPTLFGGVRNTFSWKSISISFNISFKAGYFFKRNSISYTGLFNSWNGNKDFLNRWQKPGDEAITNVPSMIYPASTARDAFYNGSQILIENGSHIRLQDISISYNLGKNHFPSTSIKNIQIYTYINNIGILWRANKYSLDPDYLSGYPAQRTISLGFKASL